MSETTTTQDLVRCRKCRGIGARFDRTCWRCDGTGWIDPGVLPEPLPYQPGAFAWDERPVGVPLPEWERRAPAALTSEQAAERLHELGELVSLADAQDRLTTAVQTAVAPVPCLGSDAWLSEDPAERQAAAVRCQQCPVLAECGQLADAMPLKAWGVFAGRDYASDDDPAALAAQLQAMSGMMTHGKSAEATTARTRRNELLVKLRGHGWSSRALAELSGLSEDQVYHVVGPSQSRSVAKRSGAEFTARQQQAKAERRARHEAEIATRNDPRVARLRELGPMVKAHPSPALRAERGRLVIEMRTEDPKFWTTERLAVAIGVTDSAAVSKLLSRALRTDEH